MKSISLLNFVFLLKLDKQVIANKIVLKNHRAFHSTRINIVPIFQINCLLCNLSFSTYFSKFFTYTEMKI